MIKAGVGCSKKQNTAAAAEEACRLALSRAGIGQADFALVFATPHHSAHYAEIGSLVLETTGAAHVAGCSGVGVLSGDEEIEIGPGMVVMAVDSDTLSGYTFMFQELTKRNRAVGRSIGQFIHEVNKGEQLLVLFPDPFSHQVSSLLTSVQEEYPEPIPIIGGCASEDPYKQVSYQFNEKSTASGSVSGIYLTGDFIHAIGISQACHPVSGPLIVTKAEGSKIFELRGRPAMELLSPLLKEPVAKRQPQALKNIMLGFTVDPSGTELASGKYIVRNITGVDPAEGSILTTDPIYEGQPLSFVVPDKKRARQEFEELVTDLAFSVPTGPPRFGLYFNCVERGNALYHSMNVDIQIIRKYFNDMPLIGFSTFGEIAPINGINTIHTYSGILALVSEPLEESL
jgi:small ligand-binding sensory domain FIST